MGYVQLNKLTCRIVIVHNFKTVTTCDGFIQQRESYVKKCFAGRVRGKPATVYREGTAHQEEVEIFESFFNEMPLLHVCLAADDSEAGKLYNPRTFAYLQSFLNAQSPVNRGELLTRLCGKVLHNLKAYMAIVPKSNVGIMVDSS